MILLQTYESSHPCQIRQKLAICDLNFVFRVSLLSVPWSEREEDPTSFPGPLRKREACEQGCCDLWPLIGIGGTLHTLVYCQHLWERVVSRFALSFHVLVNWKSCCNHIFIFSAWFRVILRTGNIIEKKKKNRHESTKLKIPATTRTLNQEIFQKVRLGWGWNVSRYFTRFKFEVQCVQLKKGRVTFAGSDLVNLQRSVRCSICNKFADQL